MRIDKGPFSVSGAAAFFFFSWVIELLFNSIVVGKLGLLKPINYWQAAELWFLVTVLFAWSGSGLVPLSSLLSRAGDLTFGASAGLFFLGAWVFQLLFNGLVAGYFGLLAPLSYLQAAGLLFLVTLLTFWLGFMTRTRQVGVWDLSDIGRRVRDEIKKFFEEW
jgi:hypothetical protein